MAASTLLRDTEAISTWQKLGALIRQHIKSGNWLYKDVAREIGMSRSWLSQVVKGRTRPSLEAVKKLAALFKDGTLIDHLRNARTSDIPPGPQVLRTLDEVRTWMLEIVRTATTCLICTGSRSSEADYLAAIVDRLRTSHDLEHYRVLYGAPSHEVLQDHLLKLVKLRSTNRRRKVKIHIGNFVAHRDAAEYSICANETLGLVVLPSLTRFKHHDTAILFVGQDAAGLISYGRGLCDASVHLENERDVRKLGINRKPK
jgi:transcriptional regulator with XRE-family HTH domain